MTLLEHKLKRRSKVAKDVSDIVECNVCFDKIQTHGIINCGHLFCFECINNWAVETSACPVCRKDFQIIKKVGIDCSEFVQINQKESVEKEDVLDLDPILFGVFISQRFLLCLQIKESRRFVVGL